MFLPHPCVKVSIVGSLCDREVACSAPDRQGSNFESCVLRTVSSHSSHHHQEVLLAQFSPYVHKCGLKPDSFHFIFSMYFYAFVNYCFYSPSSPIIRESIPIPPVADSLCYQLIHKSHIIMVILCYTLGSVWSCIDYNLPKQNIVALTNIDRPFR